MKLLIGNRITKLNKRIIKDRSWFKMSIIQDFGKRKFLGNITKY